MIIALSSNKSWYSYLTVCLNSIIRHTKKLKKIYLFLETVNYNDVPYLDKMIKKYNLSVKYVIVSEAGASIYSASKIAIEEFPDLAVEKRSAVSIGRRLQDPLAELVKMMWLT